MSASSQNITRLLLDWRNGDQTALDRLMPLVYEELRRMANHYMRNERKGHTLQTSALVNEAYLRLVDHENIEWQNRAHFFGVAAQSIRHILVDHARGHKAAKRGAGAAKLSLDEAIGVPEKKEVDLLALNEALERLAALDRQQANVVELRFFGGLSIKETAEALGIAEQTVKWTWRMARAWLLRELGDERGKGPDGDRPA
jgi:RNA polymerase sigma factor (TIGR02999 family)